MAPISLMNKILCKESNESWNGIIESLNDLFQSEYGNNLYAEIRSRESLIYNIDNLISSSAWELWESFQSSVPSTSSMLVDFWENNSDGKAVLILDGLSLREMPILIEEGLKRNYKINSQITASELPSETTPFAKSLGFSQRSSLENNQAGNNHKLVGARTECTDLPWLDSSKLIQSEPNWIFWHTWLDDRLHDLNEPGKGLRMLVNELNQQLRSDEFWSFIERLSTGRNIIITSDHGYISTGEFINVDQKDQIDYLKSNYKGQRYFKSNVKENHWVPPIDLNLESSYGEYRYVLGTKRWKVPGGYPTLTHGGLSLFEILVPFIEVTKS